MQKHSLFDLSKSGMPPRTDFSGTISDVHIGAKIDLLHMYGDYSEQLTSYMHGSNSEMSIVLPHIPMFKHACKTNDLQYNFYIKMNIESENTYTQQVSFPSNMAFNQNLSCLVNGLYACLEGYPSVLRENEFRAHAIHVNESVKPTPKKSLCRLVDYLSSRSDSSDKCLFALISRDAATNDVHDVSRLREHVNLPTIPHSTTQDNDVLIGLAFADTISDALNQLAHNCSVQAFAADCLLDKKEHYTGSKHNDLAALELVVINRGMETTPWGCVSSHVVSKLD